MSDAPTPVFALIDATNLASLSEAELDRRIDALLRRLAGPGRIVDHGKRPVAEGTQGLQRGQHSGSTPAASGVGTDSSCSHDAHTQRS